MPARLALCDLGAPGWGEPWFPHSAVLLYSHLGMAMSVMFVFSVLPLFTCHTNTSDDTMISPLTQLPTLHNWSAGHFPLLGLFLCCVFGLFCFACFFGCVSRFLVCDGIVTAYWTMYRSSTSSLLWPLNQQTAIFASIN